MIFSFDLKNMSSKCPHMCLLADPSGGIASALFCRCIPEFGSRQSSAPPRCEANAGALRAPPSPPPFPYPLPPFPSIPLGLTPIAANTDAVCFVSVTASFGATFLPAGVT